MKYTITRSRILYVYSINDRTHKGFLKIGEVMVDNEIANMHSQQELAKAVRDALKERSYMSGVDYTLEFVECTTYNQESACYKADDVHRTLISMGISSKTLARYKDPLTEKNEDADIWFACSVMDVQTAIANIKNGKGAGYGAIIFRPEQRKAIESTVKHFKKETGKSYLWNAKMRFGKTLSGLEVAKRCGYKSTLIITHRPVVDDGWSKDFEKIFRTPGALAEYRSQGLEPAYGRRMMEDRDSRGDFYSLTKDVNDGKKILVFFVSMQYLRLSQHVGGKERNFDPLKRDIMEYDWDFVMVDEAHEGIEAAAGVRVMEKLKKDKTRILSLSGTPFNLLDKYEENEIYTWDYVMEQQAKHRWDNEHYGDPNPYADLPQMQILTFTLPTMVRDAAIENNEVFKFHEFFRVWTEADKNTYEKLITEETDPLKKVDYQAKLKEIQLDRFIHEGAIRKFLDKLVEESDTSLYPFSTEEFRQHFRHTFWLLPGVKEAAALEKLLKEHNVFGEENGMFHIINAAGDGNIEDKNGSALAEVEDHIRGNSKKNITKKDYTITLSCGKLTTGVSVPEWTAVLCLKGSESTPAANYMQTIFRVQTHAVLDGRQKSDCYVFDFAPDRALTAVAETAKVAVHAQTKEGKKNLKLTQKKEEEHLAAFIKLCPVLSMDEGQMGKHFSANQIFEKLSNVYIERAVRSGYADNSLYNPDQLMNLSPEQEKALGDVRDLLGSMPAYLKPDKITITNTGMGKETDADKIKSVFYLTAEKKEPQQPSMASEFDELGRPTTKDKGWDEVMNAPSQLFPYLYVSSSKMVDKKWTSFSKPILWKEWIDEAKQTKTEAEELKENENKEKRARMSVLRGVSIRIPLLVFGAEINDEDGEEITVDNFTSLVDDTSWEEYMPKDKGKLFTKQLFNLLKDCFDRSIFTGAAKRIRQMVKEADNLSTEDRIAKIATIFSYFHNPDKETVLTPWRVVNMHMRDTLGGWCFFEDDFKTAYTVENQYGENVNAARFVDRGDVTKDVFSDYNARILEINSKTGLYPLYMAYSIFKEAKEPGYRNIKLTGERGVSKNAEQYYRQAGDDIEIWKDVLQDNIFVACRTPMAVSITKRTLAGFRKDIRMNVKCYEHDVDVNDLINSGVMKATDEGISKNGSTYYFNNAKSLSCDMITVLRARPDFFESDVVKGKDYWEVYNSIPTNYNEDINNMKFSAVVGNPPYQLMGASGGNNDAPIYQHFFNAAKDITKNYVSFIIPSRWFAAGRENLLGDFRRYMLKEQHLKTLTAYVDSHKVFPTVDIKGGICYFLVNVNYKGMCHYKLISNTSTEEHDLALNNFDILIRNPKLAPIVKKVIDKMNSLKLHNMSEIISNDTPFGIPSNPHTSKKNPFDVSSFYSDEFNTPLYIKNKVREIEFVRRTDIKKNIKDIDRIKVLIPCAAGTGQDSMILGKPWKTSLPSVCTQTFIYVGFDNENQANNFISYYKTKFFRALVSAVKITQSAANDVYQFVPVMDFSKPWDDSLLFDAFDLNLEERKYINSQIADWDEAITDLNS